VIGPSVKQPRLSVSESSWSSFPNNVDPGVITLTQGQTPTESLPVLDAARSVYNIDIPATDLTNALNKLAARPPEEKETAASIGADSWRDNVRRESSSTTSVESECVLITQEDNNATPIILENVVHQLQREADFPMDDDLFKAIEGHEWINGVLMLRLSRKTDGATTTIPFTTACKDCSRRPVRTFQWL
jgi:hypothetical protein